MSFGSTGTLACSTMGPLSTPLVHEVHGRAGDLGAVVERLPLGVQAREGRQERGVDVEAPPGEGPHVDRREDPHEARRGTSGRPARAVSSRTSARSNDSRSAKSLGLTKSASTPAARARSSAGARSRSEITTTTVRRIVRAASRHRGAPADSSPGPRPALRGQAQRSRVARRRQVTRAPRRARPR